MSINQEVINETYPLIQPFAYALIATDPKTGQLIYQVVESPISKQEEEIARMIEDVIKESLIIDFQQIANRKAASNYLRNKILDIIHNYNVAIEESSFD